MYYYKAVRILIVKLNLTLFPLGLHRHMKKILYILHVKQCLHAIYHKGTNNKKINREEN